MYRVYLRISVQYLSLLPYSECVILRVPQYALFHDFYWFAGSRHCDIVYRQFLSFFLLKWELVHSEVKQYPQSCDTETVHGVFEHETGTGDSSVTQLWTMKKTSRASELQILWRYLGCLQKGVSNAIILKIIH